MIFSRIPRIKQGPVLFLGAILLCAAGAAAYDNRELVSWALASSVSKPEAPRSASLVEDSFQTLAEFVNRSPGERGEVDTFKGIAKFVTETDQHKSAPQLPTQRALGKIFDPEPFDIGIAWQPPLELLTVPVGDFGVPLDLVPAGTGGGFTPGGSPGGVAFPPTGSTPDSGEPGGGGSVPPPIGAVPEPGTWILILLGFFSASYGLRKRKPTGVIGAEMIAL